MEQAFIEDDTVQATFVMCFGAFLVLVVMASFMWKERRDERKAVHDEVR